MSTRKKKNNKNKSQQNKIVGRLIEISLQVDEYIYKNKPIHITTAKKYAKEIALYKPMCSGDQRSLQVIEKLALFLKKMIQEKSPIKENSYLPTLPSETDKSKVKQADAITNYNKEKESNHNANNNHNLEAEVLEIPVEKLTTGETKQVNVTDNDKEFQLNSINFTIVNCSMKKPDLGTILSHESINIDVNKNDNNSLGTSVDICKETLNQIAEISIHHDDFLKNNVECNTASTEKCSFREMDNTKAMEYEDTVTQYMNEIDLERTLSNLSVSCLIDPIENNTDVNLENIIESLDISKPQEIDKGIFLSDEQKNKPDVKLTYVENKISINDVSHSTDKLEKTECVNNSPKTFNPTLTKPIKPCNNQRKLFNIYNTNINLNVSEEDNLENTTGDDGNNVNKLKCIHALESVKKSANKTPKNSVIKPRTANRKRNKSKPVENQNKKVETNKKVSNNPMKTKKQSSLEPKLKRKRKTQDTKRTQNIKIKAKTDHFTSLDLSWVNDIKYVRVIEQNEFESLAISDSFWNDTSIPLCLQDMLVTP